MPTIIGEERWDSRNGTDGLESGDTELVFVVAHATSEAEAVAFVAASSDVPPAIYQPISGRMLVITSYSWEIADGDLIHVTVHYGPRKPPEPGTFRFTFDTTGKTEKRTHSISTVQKKAASGTAPDFKNAINVTENGVEGVELPTSGFKWTESHKLPASAITWAYSDVLSALTGMVNNATFRNKPAKTVMFHGVQGGKDDEETGTVNFNFEYSRNATGLTVGSITGIDKKGWEYLWVRYKCEEDTTAKALVKRPEAVYVEEVVIYADFSALGIGTT